MFSLFCVTLPDSRGGPLTQISHVGSQSGCVEIACPPSAIKKNGECYQILRQKEFIYIYEMTVLVEYNVTTPEQVGLSHFLLYTRQEICNGPPDRLTNRPTDHPLTLYPLNLRLSGGV